ncbi:hypothetical protein ACFOVU_13945 [Nocardiopsis sediminis]|uniref:Cytochrome c domain-containing protein n=1 Tax=Nocardiopsis sediminis TaxID=1778267 RepID=A0ABV8FLK6_9ACTN
MVATALLWFAAALTAASAAPAAADGLAPSPSPNPPYVGDTTRTERIAEALHGDPLFVDPEAAEFVGAEERGELADLIAGADHPVYVVVAPSTPYDESGGDRELFLHAVRHAMGEDGDGVYIAAAPPDLGTGPYRLTTVLFGVPVDEWAALYPEDAPDPPADDIPTAQGRLLAQQVATVLEGVDTAPSAPAESPVPLAAPEPSTDSGFVPEEPAAGDYTTDLGPGLFVGALLGGALLGAVAGIAALLRRRLRVRPVVAPEAERHLPESLRARRAPTRPSHRRLVRMLDTELRRLTRELAGTPHGHADHAAAVAAYDAAMLIRNGGRDDQWLVGGIVMVRAARAALTTPEPDSGRAFCLANPLHGAALEGRAATRYGKPTVRLPAKGPQGAVCAACHAVAGLDRPLTGRVLRLRSDGEWRPHYLADGFWTATQYGRRIPDLPRRVLKELDAD